MGQVPPVHQPHCHEQPIRHEIDGYMEAWLLDYTKEELLQIAMEHRVPLAPVRGYDEVRHDEKPGWAVYRDHSRGHWTCELSRYPLRIDGPSTAGPSPAPYLGQHNDAIYSGMLGYTNEQLVKLHQTGII